MGNRSDIVTSRISNTIIYSDFTTEFAVNPLTQQLALVTNGQDVIDSIKRLIMLQPFEREYEDIGGGIVQKLLWEQADTATTTALQQDITNTINTFEPRAQLVEVTVTLSPKTQDYYVVNVAFFLQNNPDPISFNMILNRIR